MATSDQIGISKLPAEILNLILYTVLRDHGAGILTGALRVTRQWHGIGSKILWQDTVLVDSKIIRFVDAISKPFTNLALTGRLRSLTLRLTSPGNDDFRVDSFSRSIKSLASLLPRFTGLKTFSISSCYNASNPWSTGEITGELIIHLIESLPRSIQHLEVDVQVVYFKENVARTCLCEVISTRLEGLQSLRLKWPRLCSKLFRRRSTTLRHFSLDCCNSRLSAYVKGCRSSQRNHQMSWDLLQRYCNKLSHLAVRGVLVPLKGLEVHQMLPNIQHFVIIEPYHFWPRHSSNQWSVVITHRYSETENSSTPQLNATAYPVWSTGFGDGEQWLYIIRRCIHETHTSRGPLSTHDCSETDLHSTGGWICQRLEGSADWTTSDIQSRKLPFAQYRQPAGMAESFINKAQWEALYRQKRTRLLHEEFGPHATIAELGQSTNLEQDFREAKAFQKTYMVKPKLAGADWIWYVEQRLGHNVLWARRSSDGFPAISDEELQEQFTSEKEWVERAQEDIPWDD